MKYFMLPCCYFHKICWIHLKEIKSTIKNILKLIMTRTIKVKVVLYKLILYKFKKKQKIEWFVSVLYHMISPIKNNETDKMNF